MTAEDLAAKLGISELSVIQLHLTHVLITRPLDASLELAAWLEGRSNSPAVVPIVMPLYGFSQYRPRPALASLWSIGGVRRLAVFTSTRAVSYGLPLISAEMARGLEFAAVGAATRRRLEEAGQRVQIQAASGYTSEDLLREPALSREPGEAVIFCAPGGRDKLKQGLSALGWRVFQALVYQRQPIDPEPGRVEQIMQSKSLLSVWTSVSALRLAQKGLPADAWQKILAAPALVISTRIQHYLQQHGARCVSLARGPGNEALAASIESLLDMPEPAAS